MSIGVLFPCNIINSAMLKELDRSYRGSLSYADLSNAVLSSADFWKDSKSFEECIAQGSAVLISRIWEAFWYIMSFLGPRSK